MSNAMKKELTLDASETDWFKHANKVVEILRAYHNIPMDDIRGYILEHYLDCLTFLSKMTLLINLYSPDFNPKREVENKIKSYFDERIVQYKNVRGIVLANGPQCKIYVQNGIEWTEAKKTDKEKLSQLIIQKYVVPVKKFEGTLLGFMHFFRKREVVFKIKDMAVERSTGARLENEKKGDVIKTLNILLKNKAYTVKNAEQVLKHGLCAIVEIVMRDYSKKERDGKVWFFDTERAILNNIA
jgi:hypothetical protein